MLGGFAAHVHGKPLARLRSRQGQRLLGLLVLRGNRESERDWLAATLWPDSSPTQALYNLRRNLTDLRQALGPEGNRLSPGYSRSLRLDLTEASVDVLAFDAAIKRGDTASLEQAVALYRGALLEDYAEDWVLPERRAREQAYLLALETLAAHSMNSHDPDSAARYLRQILATDPFHETALRALLEALAALGEYAAMKQVYRDFRLYLHRQMHAEPAEETAALYQRLQRQESDSLVAAAAPAPLASRRLPQALTHLIGRELEIQEVVTYLKTTRLLTLTGEGGIGKTRLAITAAETSVNNYAGGVCFVDLSPLFEDLFIASSIATALGVTANPARRPLENLVEFLQAKPLLLVLDNCEHLIDGCAQTVDALLSHCPSLHVMATSRQPLGLTGEVVWRVPSLPFPPPSRNPLSAGQGAGKTRAEKDEISILVEYPAVRLFVERARHTRPDLPITLSVVKTIAQICRRLDGTPLAIELAAARVSALSITEIDARLEDRFRLLTGGSRSARPRQYTLQASLDWSYGLLNEPEKRLLRRLSVFAGGWTLEAAEQVTGYRLQGIGEEVFPVPSHEVLDLLTNLVNKSLVVYEEQSGQGWYRLLETIRQYSRERLAGCGEEVEAVRQRHAVYYLALAEQAEPQILGPEQKRWLERLEKEHSNLRAAMIWFQQSDDQTEGSARLDQGLRLAGCLWRFWWLHGHLSEGRERLMSMIRKKGTDHPTRELAGALCGAGNLAQCQGDYVQATLLFEQALTMMRALDGRSGESDMLFHLGDVASNQGNYADARSQLEQALAIYQNIGNRHGEAKSLGQIGYILREQGDFAAACSLHEAALDIHRNLGDRMNEVWVLSSLGYVYHGQGDPRRAQDAFAQALEIYRAFGNRSGEAWSLASLGFITYAQGDYASACPLLEEALAINRELDNSAGEAWDLDLLGSALCGMEDYSAAHSALEQALAINRRIGSRNAEASNLRHLGDSTRGQKDVATAHRYYVEAAALMRELDSKSDLMEILEAYVELSMLAGQPERAAQFYEASQALRQTHALPPCPIKRDRDGRLISDIHAALTESSYVAARNEGQKWTLDKALDYAMAMVLLPNDEAA